MKIAVHVEQLDDRGCGTVTYDYSVALRDILGWEPIIMASRPKTQVPTSKYSEFKTVLYEHESEIPSIVDKEKIDLFWMLKGGWKREGVTPSNCRTGIHCIFNMSEPHGDVYAGVSEWLARCFGHTKWVPHIINPPKTTETLRDELGIPKDAFVIGRLGGLHQFNVPDARSAVNEALEKRNDLWAVFLNTEKFTDHPRAKFLPFNPSNLYKSKFINTTDAMVHGRSDGETFGLAVGEFSFFNKPVFTYDAPYPYYGRAHIDLLGEKALLYKNHDELLSYLLQIDKNYINGVDWDCYSQRFSPRNVMRKFKDVFFDDRTDVVEAKHGKFIVLSNDSLGASLIEKNDFEPHFNNVAKNVLGKGDVCIDCGSNLGYHTVTMAKLVGPSGGVISIEPQRSIFQQLSGNVFLNKLRNVITLNLALGDTNGEVTLDPIDIDAPNAINTGYGKVGFGGEKIGMTRLDDIITSDVKFVKVDVQGCEMKLLLGAEKMIKESRPIFFIEVENQWLKCFGENSETLLNKLLSLDYVLVRINTEYPCDHVAIPKEQRNMLDHIMKDVGFPIDIIEGKSIKLNFDRTDWQKDINYGTYTITT